MPTPATMMITVGLAAGQRERAQQQSDPGRQSPITHLAQELLP